MNTIKVLSKGQIVIPVSIRKKFKIKPGGTVTLFDYGNTIYIVPQNENPVEEARGILPAQPSLTDELLNERKKDFGG
ncbi:MAG: AbrB/MazE/SpoVT family DNA-binding domain-containing protein [Proteobacteria bacterium]|nr:AbrB/MazE/SpoVT family DNA-binding domain-containing protein [Pseudomonadota bacterium]